MTRRSATQAPRVAAAITMLAASLMWSAACGTDDGNPTSPSGGPGSGAGTGSGGSAEACDDGEVRECKVDIDANNCFVGVQECVGDTWGACQEGNDTLALGGSTGCPSNPCNPGCNQFDETPSSPLTPPAGGTPATASGDPSSLPATWQDAAFNDNNHAYNSDCSSSGSCQLDSYCSANSPKNCLPWGENDFDPNINFDLTVKMVCDPDSVIVCNRGGTVAPSGMLVEVWDDNINYLDPGGGAICNGMAGLGGTLYGTCSTPSAINPGDCISVSGCGSAITSGGGIKTLYINNSDQSTPPYDGNEEECANNWSIYDPNAGCACSSAAEQATLSPVDLYVFLDNSGSMNTNNPDRWVEATDALTTFYQSSLSDDLNVAYRAYGNNPSNGCDDNSCSSAACADPEVVLGPLGPGVSATETALVNAISANSAPGGNGTPHQPVLGGMAQWGIAQATTAPTHTVANVYITDGDYNGCSTNTASNVGPIASAYANYGVLTYIVALPGINGGVFNNFITDVATAGGTTPIDLRNSGNNVGTDLTNELVAIQNALASCNVTLANPSTIDPNNVSVDYLPNGTTPATAYNQVTDAASCTGANDEFHLDDNTNPTAVVLCPAACSVVQADSNALLQIVAGCSSGYTAQTQTFDYFADCPSGKTPIWELLEYDTTIPGDATVDWEVSTGPTAADAAAGPGVQVATSTAANPDAPSASPVDIETPLIPNHVQPYLELRITMNPTSNGTGAPTVESWNLKYTCADEL